jgi:phosphatidylglycerol lysyltransferase
VALVANDPVGKPVAANSLVRTFEEYCFTNDWAPAFIHTEPGWSAFYRRHGYSLQKIGEEAMVDIGHFQKDVRRNKYFRHITNKFGKSGFTTEILTPPHNQAVVNRLRKISDEWLTLPGRAERGFLLGYFNDDYLQRCPIIVVRDAASTIQAFANILPLDNPDEISYDLLRYSLDSPGNINDFLLLALFAHGAETGYKRLNMGLCPLVGLGDNKNDSTVLNNMLQFAYANGDRFYSFSGLHRFKSKYEPDWESRYVAYKGGIRGFTRALTALNKALQLSKKQLRHL